MQKSKKEINYSHPVGGHPGLPYLPLVVTEVAAGEDNYKDKSKKTITQCIQKFKSMGLNGLDST